MPAYSVHWGTYTVSHKEQKEHVILALKHPSNKADSHHTKATSSNKPSVTRLPGEFCVGINFPFSPCTTCCHSLNFENDQRPI